MTYLHVFEINNFSYSFLTSQFEFLELLTQLLTKCKKLNALGLRGHIKVDESDIAPQNSEGEPIQHEQFTNLTKISIDVRFFHFCEELHSAEEMTKRLGHKERLIEKLKKFLPLKFPNLKHPIQVDDKSHDDSYIRFESRPADHTSR